MARFYRNPFIFDGAHFPLFGGPRGSPNQTQRGDDPPIVSSTASEITRHSEILAVKNPESAACLRRYEAVSPPGGHAPYLKRLILTYAQVQFYNLGGALLRGALGVSPATYMRDFIASDRVLATATQEYRGEERPQLERPIGLKNYDARPKNLSRRNGARPACQVNPRAANCRKEVRDARGQSGQARYRIARQRNASYEKRVDIRLCVILRPDSDYSRNAESRRLTSSAHAEPTNLPGRQ